MAENIILYHKPIRIDNDLWISSANDNGLYKIGLSNSECEFVRMFPNESFKRGYLHSSSVKFGDELFFVPFAGKYISVYNLNNGLINCYRLEHYSDEMSSLFYSSVVKGENLYLIPCRYEYIVEFNMRAKVINEYKVFDRNGKKLSEIKPFVLKGVCSVNGKIYIGENAKNQLIEFDLNTKKVSEYEIPYDLSGISNLEYVDDEIWVFGKNGLILYGSLRQGNFEVLEDAEKDDERHFGVYYETLVDGKNIYVSKSSGRTLCKINAEEKKIVSLIKFSDTLIKSDFCPVDMFAMYRIDKEIRALDSVTGKTYRYDCGQEKIIEDPLPPITEEMIDYSKYKGNEKGTNVGFRERRGLELSSFLQCLSEGQYDMGITYEGVEGKSVMINEGQ